MITIEYKQIVERGERLIEITKLDALSSEKLPKKYCQSDKAFEKVDCFGRDAFWGNGINSEIKASGGRFLVVGSTYTPKEYKQIEDLVRASGAELRRINEELKRENEGWEGVRVRVEI